MQGLVKKVAVVLRRMLKSRAQNVLKHKSGPFSLFRKTSPTDIPSNDRQKLLSQKKICKVLWVLRQANNFTGNSVVAEFNENLMNHLVGGKTHVAKEKRERGSDCCFS